MSKLFFVLVVQLPFIVFFFLAPSFASTVRLQTSLGLVDIELLDTATPLTVANFLNYVNNGAFSNSLIHRSVPGFILQGGGFTYKDNNTSQIQHYQPISNEFSTSRSNLRGTIAMAKSNGDPDSATSEWFINLADNSANLDTQNGGFTVFGHVIGQGMTVIDAIAALQVVNAGGVFTDLPLVSMPPSGVVEQDNLVLITSIKLLTAATDSDRVFNYLESFYPDYISPASGVSGIISGYFYRYYAGTNSYVGTADGYLYYLGAYSGNDILSLGKLDDWIGTAASAGY